MTIAQTLKRLGYEATWAPLVREPTCGSVLWITCPDGRAWFITMSYMAEELAATVRDAHGIEITGADIYALWEARTPWKKLSRERRDAIISVRRAYNKADREYWKQLEDNAFPGGCTRVLPSDFHS